MCLDGLYLIVEWKKSKESADEHRGRQETVTDLSHLPPFQTAALNHCRLGPEGGFCAFMSSCSKLNACEIGVSGGVKWVCSISSSPKSLSRNNLRVLSPTAASLPVRRASYAPGFTPYHIIIFCKRLNCGVIVGMAGSTTT